MSAPQVSALSPAIGERIGVREFARRDGCDEKEVRRALAKGTLFCDSSRLLDAARVGSAWRKRYRLRRAVAALEGADTGCGHLCERYRCPHQVSAPEVSALATAAGAFVARLDHSGFDAFLADLLAGKFATVAEAERIKANALALRHLLAARNEAKRLIGSVAAPRLDAR